MDRMCGDESRHAVRTLYSDLIDDNEIRHPNHYCWLILLSLLNVMAIMEFSSPLISWQDHMCPLLLSPALHQYMKALCFVREAEQMGRTSLHCVCKAVTEEYNGSFILLRKHGTACSSVNRVRTKYNRAEHSHPLSLGLSTCTRSLYQPDIYVQNFPSVVELDVSLCPKPKRATGLSRSHKISILRCPNLQVLQCVPALDICNRLSHAQKDQQPLWVTENQDHRLPK